MSFPPEKRADLKLNIDLDGFPVERTLGFVIWHRESDTFAFSFGTLIDATTKREVYSAVYKIFDPLGFHGMRDHRSEDHTSKRVEDRT